MMQMWFFITSKALSDFDSQLPFYFSIIMYLLHFDTFKFRPCIKKKDA